MSPRDLNTLLIGYEGGVVVWDMKEKQATKHFEFLLPPGQCLKNFGEIYPFFSCPIFGS